MYHYVRDVTARPRVGYRSLDRATFEAQLDSICRVRTPVPWAALLDAVHGGRALPRDAILLTFDDGLADHHRDVLPSLAARGLPGVFFVLARSPHDGLAVGHKLHVLGAAMGSAALRDAMTERLSPADVERYSILQANLRAAGVSDPDDPWKRPLQRELEPAAAPILSGLIRERLGPETDLARELYLDARQLNELVANGMALGGHGRDHPWLEFVGRARVRAELAASASFLAAFDGGPWPFAYPYGGVPRGAGSLLSEAGFAAAFTTRADEHHDRYRIGRHDGDELYADAHPIAGREAAGRATRPPRVPGA
ncbi:MAG TPA: polysaccharide deacetylase family protein [Candidatus Deferrimicrobium sp.]|nr:polysaccharide deacetylase family protein [Candidatus Deferrimicrobium sp.]